MSTAPSPEAEEFLRRLRLAFSRLSRQERDDVLAEIRLHFTERARAGQELALGQFGGPDQYAAQFIAESTLRSALAKGTPFALGHALLFAARGTLFALLVLASGGLSGGARGAQSLVFFPDNVGLFFEPGGCDPPRSSMGRTTSQAASSWFNRTVGSPRTSQPSPVIWSSAWCLLGSFSDALSARLSTQAAMPCIAELRLAAYDY